MSLYREWPEREWPETVRVSVELPGAVVAALDVFRLADCWAKEMEPVSMSLYLSWWICYNVESHARMDSSPAGRRHYYADELEVLHHVPMYRALPFSDGFRPKQDGPGDFVNGRPWWLVPPSSRRKRRVRRGLL